MGETCHRYPLGSLLAHTTCAIIYHIIYVDGFIVFITRLRGIIFMGLCSTMFFVCLFSPVLPNELDSLGISENNEN